MRTWNNALIPFVDRSSVGTERHLYKLPASLGHHTRYPKTQFQPEHIGHFARGKLMGFHRHLQEKNRCVLLVDNFSLKNVGMKYALNNIREEEEVFYQPQDGDPGIVVIANCIIYLSNCTQVEFFFE